MLALKELLLEQYDSHWRAFVSYCTDKGWAPLRLSIPQLCEYLRSLSVPPQQLKPATVEGYCAAVASVLSHEGTLASRPKQVQALLNRLWFGHGSVFWSPFCPHGSDKDITIQLLLLKVSFLPAQEGFLEWT